MVRIQWDRVDNNTKLKNGVSNSDVPKNKLTTC